jgi:hypothetical protein
MEVVMTSQQLPERANLEQLKKQAKSLLHAAQAGEPDALRRFQPGAASLALHDAQSVIAREYGFKSWNELREHVQDRSLSFEAAVDEFLRCATGGAAARALRLLERHASIAHASLYTELVLGDSAAVEERLRKHPVAATRTGGMQIWEPLLYVCHTCLNENKAGLVEIARAAGTGRKSQRRIPLELASRTPAHGVVGSALRGQPPSARGGTA